MVRSCCIKQFMKGSSWLVPWSICRCSTYSVTPMTRYIRSTDSFDSLSTYESRSRVRLYGGEVTVSAKRKRWVAQLAASIDISIFKGGVWWQKSRALALKLVDSTSGTGRRAHWHPAVLHFDEFNWTDTVSFTFTTEAYSHQPDMWVDIVMKRAFNYLGVLCKFEGRRHEDRRCEKITLPVRLRGLGFIIWYSI